MHRPLEARLDIKKQDDIDMVSLVSGNCTAEVALSLGANLFRLTVDGRPLLEPVPWQSFLAASHRFGIPLLQPFANRIKDGTFQFKGQTYQLATSRNGLVRNLPWSLVSLGASQRDGAWVTCRLDSQDYQDEIMAQFPFAFVSTVTYRLYPTGVEIVLEIENAGDADLPCSQGVHPYLFAGPDASVSVPAQSRFKLDDMIPNGEIERVDGSGEFDLRSPRLVQQLALDDLFTDLDTSAEGLVTCRIENGQSTTLIEFERQSFPYVMLYTPVDRKCICIEPYSSRVNAHNQHDGDLVVLAPGEKHRGVIRIYNIEVPSKSPTA